MQEIEFSEQNSNIYFKVIASVSNTKQSLFLMIINIYSVYDKL